MTSFAYEGAPITEPAVSIANSLLPLTADAIDSWVQADLDQRGITSTGMVIDPDAGVIGLTAFDCLGSPAGGVDVSINLADAAAWPAAPDAASAGTTAARTLSGGGLLSARAAFFNLPSGNWTVTATVPGVGRVSQVTCTTAPGTFTQAGMPPTP